MPPTTDEQTLELPDEVSTYIDELEKANRDLSTKLTDALAKGDDEDDDEDGDDIESELADALAKADPAVQALLEKQATILDEVTKRMGVAEEVAKSERDARLTREFITKAAEYEALPVVKADEFGLFLKSAAEKLDEQEFGVLTEVLDAATELAKSSDVFKEAGSTGAGNDGGTDVEKAAAKLMAEDPTLDKFTAVAKAVELDPTLFTKES